jgi:Cu-Zn family superoxide dismutase
MLTTSPKLRTNLQPKIIWEIWNQICFTNWRMIMKYLPLIAAILLPLASPVFAVTHSDIDIAAEVMSHDGVAGTIRLTQEASGVVVVKIDLTGVSAGEHGVHIHEIGDCSSTDFKSAGGHLANGMQHGVMVEGGPHPGDMPNVIVGEDGVLSVTYFKTDLTPEMLMDDDGAGFIVHSGADDYSSQPSGAAGSRIACAVLVAPR